MMLRPFSERLGDGTLSQGDGAKYFYLLPGKRYAITVALMLTEVSPRKYQRVGLAEFLDEAVWTACSSEQVTII